MNEEKTKVYTDGFNAKSFVRQEDFLGSCGGGKRIPRGVVGKGLRI